MDQMNKAMLIFSLVMMVISILFSRHMIVSMILDACGLAGLVLVYFRMFSKNIAARSEENKKYLAFTASIRRRIGKEKYMAEQRKQYHIYKCPECGQKVRIPRGLGKKLEIDCPKCHNKFIKRS